MIEKKDYSRNRNKGKTGNSIATPACLDKQENQMRNDWMKISMSGIFGGGLH